MAGKSESSKVKKLESIRTDRRKLIGQAIIDGILTPQDAAFLPNAADPDYNQGTGNYTQKGGDHKQGNGDYNQAQSIANIRDQVTNVIRDLGQVTRGQ
jgi:hypothetical protein